MGRSQMNFNVLGNPDAKYYINIIDEVREIYN